MNIYMYNKNTKEYIGSAIAEADPEETRIKGCFVPLIPDCAVLECPPEFGENEVPIYTDNGWVIEKDYRRTHVKVDGNLNIYKITEIGEPDNFIIVPIELGEKIQINPNHYKIINGEIAEKTEEEIRNEEINLKKEQFKKEFFKTSLGWIRRTVTMKDGSKKDFLSDLLPAIKAGLDNGQTVQIIGYSEPDFNKELKPIEEYQNVKIVNQMFINECLNQLVNDFGMQEVV